MDYKIFKDLPPMDQVISLSGMESDDSKTLKAVMGLINSIAMGAQGDKPQEEVDKIIDIVFNGEPDGTD